MKRVVRTAAIAVPTVLMAAALGLNAPKAAAMAAPDKNALAACGSGYRLAAQTNINVSTGKATSKMLVQVLRKGNTFCGVTLRKGSAKGHRGKTTIVANSGNFHGSDSGKYTTYAGPVKRKVASGKRITFQGSVGSIVSPVLILRA